MKKLVVLFLFLSPLTAFAESYCASGWGVTADNGTWVNSGTYNGHNYYLNGTQYAYYPTNGNGWYFGDTGFNNGCPDYYSPNAGGATLIDTPYPSTDWAQCGGAAPVGTIVAGACGGASAPTSILGLVRSLWLW